MIAVTKNRGPAEVPGELSLQLQAELDGDDDFLLFVSIENEDGDTIVEVFADDATEVDEFFAEVDRLKANYESWKGVKSG